MTRYDNINRRQLMGGLLGGAAAAALSTGPSFGQSPDTIKMSLEFRIYGGNAPMFYGQQGIFAKHRIAMNCDGSSGSDESVRRVAAGNYQFGFADASTVVAFAGLNPQIAPKVILPVFDRFPACIISLKKKPVNSVEDLKKVKIGSGTADAGAKLFPVLMALNKVDMKSLDITTVDVKLRDALLLTGKVDAVIAFDYTSVFNLIGNGLKMEDINIFYFSDMGYGMFGNSLIAHPDVIASNPDLVKRVAAATNEAWVAADKNRQAAIDAVVARDKLLDPKVELQRMSWVYDKNIKTDNVKANGLGTADLDRMKKAIDLIKQGFQLPTAPSIESVFDNRFLPPQKDRMFA